MEVEHDDEFAYTCEELTIIEDVDDVEKRRKEQGVIDIDACHSFYPTPQTPLANQYPVSLTLPDFSGQQQAEDNLAEARSRAKARHRRKRKKSLARASAAGSSTAISHTAVVQLRPGDLPTV